jgi:hypothetical protein
VREFKGVPGEWQLFAARHGERAGIRQARAALHQATKVQALKRAPLFEGLSRKELVLLARVTEDLEVPAGEVLCREVESGQEFFVIREGGGLAEPAPAHHRRRGGARAALFD